MIDSIFSQIRRESSDFYDGHISVVPGYSFNQYNTLKRAHLYLNSKFENGATYMGKEPLFFNVITPPCEVATRMLNVDTKHIRLYPMEARSVFSTFLLEKELKQWLKTSNMGVILNQIAEEAPRYGCVVLEKTKKGAEVVDLRKLINDPTVEKLKDSRFITTIHYMTPTQLRETGWDNVEDAISRFGNVNAMESFEDDDGNLNQMVSTPYIKVYKRYGEVPEKWLKGSGNSEKMVRALFIVAGADDVVKDDEGKEIYDNGVILFKSKWQKEYPFKDFHYTKVKGRWLGMGIPEMLFDVQERINEIKNQKRVSMEMSSIHLFQTKDKTIVRNVLTDLESGDILVSPNGIEPVVNEERNLPAFKDEEESYKMQADRLSFAYEAVRGESMPSSTPATNALIATQTATSVYGFKRENLANMYREFFNDLVLPQLLSDLTPEHIMRFTGSAQELEKIDRAAAEIYANDKIKESLLNGKLMSPEEIEAAKELYIGLLKKGGDTRFINIKEQLYKDVKFEFDFIVSNEQADPAVLAQNTQAVLSPLIQSYGLEDPRVKMLFRKFAEQLGISQAEIELADTQSAEKKGMQPEMTPNISAPQQAQSELQNKLAVQ